ncbi:MAG: helix-turn-helix transcriptional regulator [Actinomycetota bacterium]|nr:helix-turn-helix transcriptional regulator [Acidimicrobiia bacterium]MDQ3293348.1 helix-turn-helix transcriptional regulator [Actinomycetota bacterium]
MSAQENLDGGSVGLPRAYLRPCLLLLLLEGGSHGYELLEQVRALGLVGADAGGLYRTLRAMERDGLVSSWWEPSQSGPARRTYELTDAGTGDLDQSMKALAETRRLLGEVLARYDWLALRRETR